MADDKKNLDEYEYPSEDDYKGEEYRPEGDAYEPLEPGRGARRSFLSRRLFVILGLLCAIGLVYLWVAYRNARKSAELAAPTPVETQAAASIPPTTMNTLEAQQLATPPAQVAPTPSEPTVQNLAAQNQANQQSIANLQGQMQQIQGQLNTITSSITTLNSQIQVLANEIRAIAVGRQVRGRDISLITAGKDYILKALVPGRAWLQARGGNTTTVTIGDRLPGYGIIQMINVQQGVVTTSSGRILQYGPRDS